MNREEALAMVQEFGERIVLLDDALAATRKTLATALALKDVIAAQHAQVVAENAQLKGQVEDARGLVTYLRSLDVITTGARADCDEWLRATAENAETLPTAQRYGRAELGHDELVGIACAAVILADAGPDKNTGPMWSRIWSLLNDRVRGALKPHLDRLDVDPRTGRARDTAPAKEKADDL